jgi:chromosome segregation ATPase
MPTTDPQKAPTAISARYVSADEPGPPKRRNWFIWISALLAVIVIALIVWNLSLQSDLDDANAKAKGSQGQVADVEAENKDLQAQVKELEAQTKDLQTQVSDLETGITDAKETGNATAAEYRSAYEDLQTELGTTQSDLAATQKELESAQAAAEQADKDAAAAQQQVDDAQSAADKTQAEADQAQADAKAATANATLVKDCGNAFLDQVDIVLSSDDPTAAATSAKKELQGIAGDCKAALGRD